MNPITVSAPAKLILLGEHAVLHGCPALAIPVFPNAITLSFTPDDTNKTQLRANTPIPEKALQMMHKDLEDLCDTFGISLSGILTITFNIPPGSGLGASAAWSVSLSKLAQGIKTIPESEILKYLQTSENIHHGGQASGIDHHTIWNNTPTLLADKQINPLTKNFISEKIMKNCAVFFTGIPEESTASMIRNTTPNIDQKDIKKLKDSANSFLENKKTSTSFIHTINTFGLWLESINAVNPEIIKKCKALRNLGGGAKICGAGGFISGSGFGLVYHPDKQKLTDWSNSHNIKLYSINHQLSPLDFFPC